MRCSIHVIITLTRPVYAKRETSHAAGSGLKNSAVWVEQTIAIVNQAGATPCRRVQCRSAVKLHATDHEYADSSTLPIPTVSLTGSFVLQRWHSNPWNYGLVKERAVVFDLSNSWCSRPQFVLKTDWREFGDGSFCLLHKKYISTYVQNMMVIESSIMFFGMAEWITKELGSCQKPPRRDYFLYL